MTSLYNGWTPPEKTEHEKLVSRAEICMQWAKHYRAMGDLEQADEYQNMAAELAIMALQMATDEDDCSHCNDSMCKCTYHNQEIPY